jgi:Icc-related predicted phosphoesterase
MPILVKWGDVKSIYIAPPEEDMALDGWSVSLLDKVSGVSFQLDLMGVSWVDDNRSEMVINRYIEISVRFPEGIDRGLYNLVIERTGSYVEPNSVYVFGESYPDRLVVAHVSDTHLGPSKKPKYMKEDKFFWRAVSTIESMGADIIIVSGDFIDGSRDEAVHEMVYQWLSSLNIPIVIAMGNTDNSVIEGGKYYWEKYMAPDSGATRVNNVLILSINSRNGDLPNRTLDWIDGVLASNVDASIKVYISHYPLYSTNDNSQRVLAKIREWADKYGLNLALDGHIHRDNVVDPPDAPIKTIVTTSTAESKYYRGFRFIYLGSDGGISYDEASINLYNEYVEFSQLNDYSSVAQVVSVNVSRGNSTITVKLKDLGVESTVEGGRKLGEYAYGGRRTVFVSAVEGSSVKVYQVLDDTPPEVKVSLDITVNEVNLRPIVSDYGLGVKDVKVYYSSDNSSWIDFPPKVEDTVSFYVMATPKVEIFYYKVVVEDYAGNAVVSYGSKETGISVQPPPGGGTVPTTQPSGGGEVPKTQPAKPPVDFTLYIVLGVLVVVFLLILFRRFRR